MHKLPTYKGYTVEITLKRSGRSKIPYLIGNSGDVYRFCKPLINDSREVALAIYLDGKNQVCGVYEVSKGSATTTLVHPREYYKAALLTNAAGTIFVHQHVSGIARQPSNDDMTMTKRLREAGELLGIRFLDSIIIGNRHYLSMADEGML